MRIIGIFPLKKAPSRENGVRFWTKVSSFCMAVAVRDRISTAGWAVLSGYVVHSCGKLASGQLSTCHETVEPRWACRGSDRGEPDIGSTESPNSQPRGPGRISTAGWAVLSGHVDHACGKLASGQLGTCHETVEPRWDCRGSDRGEPDIGSTVSPNSCLLYTSPSPRDATLSRMPSSA